MYYPSLAYAGLGDLKLSNIAEQAWAGARKFAPTLMIAGFGLFLINMLVAKKNKGIGSTIISLASIGAMAVGGYFIVTNAAATSKYAGEEEE